MNGRPLSVIWNLGELPLDGTISETGLTRLKVLVLVYDPTEAVPEQRIGEVTLDVRVTEPWNVELATYSSSYAGFYVPGHGLLDVAAEWPIRLHWFSPPDRQFGFGQNLRLLPLGASGVGSLLIRPSSPAAGCPPT